MPKVRKRGKMSRMKYNGGGGGYMGKFKGNALSRSSMMMGRMKGSSTKRTPLGKV